MSANPPPGGHDGYSDGYGPAHAHQGGDAYYQDGYYDNSEYHDGGYYEG